LLMWIEADTQLKMSNLFDISARVEDTPGTKWRYRVI
jgi:hypothetical protein